MSRRLGEDFLAKQRSLFKWEGKVGNGLNTHNRNDAAIKDIHREVETEQKVLMTHARRKKQGTSYMHTVRFTPRKLPEERGPGGKCARC